MAGPHDGTQLVERALDWLMRARRATAFVQSTGNYNLRRVHSCGRLRSGEEIELPFQVNPGDDTPNELKLVPRQRRSGCGLSRRRIRRSSRFRWAARKRLNTQGRRTGIFTTARAIPITATITSTVPIPERAARVWKAMLRGIDVVDGRYHAWLERDPGCKPCQAQFLPDHSVRETTTGSICNAS